MDASFAGDRSRPARRAGFSLVELVVVLAIAAVAASMFASAVLSARAQNAVERENALAVEAARVAVERMRAAPFAELVRRYNRDPADDPGGPGTAPGPRFAVEGLAARAADGLVGEIVLPIARREPGGLLGGVVRDPVGALGGLGGKLGGALGGGPAPPATAGSEWELREDFVHELLGMPRDLNGDGVADDRDHAHDYLLLPVEVRIQWDGHLGPRSLSVFTTLTDFGLEG